jgi:hypothetical protein
VEAADFFLDPLIPASVLTHTGQHDAHLDRPRGRWLSKNPTYSAVTFNERITPVQPSPKADFLTDCVTIDVVELEAESLKAYVPGLPLERMEVALCPQTLTDNKKLKINPLTPSSFSKFRRILHPSFHKSPSMSIDW